MPVLLDWAIEPYLKLDTQLTNKQVLQSFLVRIKSWLANKLCFGVHNITPKVTINCGTNGMLFTHFLDELCKIYNINPLWILASIQREQSGIYVSRELPKYVQDKILGYGITEQGIYPQFLGFENQIKHAIRTLRNYDSKVINYTNLKIKLYDSAKDREWLAKQNIEVIDPYTPQSKTDAKALIYTPRLRALYLSKDCFNRIYEGVKQTLAKG